ncbi:MAG TPA: hydroxylamine reductase [Symbiobacteriaceae bacterium]
MFCYQCEQRSKGTGCTVMGVCGKDPRTAALQDLLVYAVKGIGMYAHRAVQRGRLDRGIGQFVIEALFTTVTNVNFDPENVADWVTRAAVVKDQARALYEAACQEAGEVPETLGGPAAWRPGTTVAEMLDQAAGIALTERFRQKGEDIVGLQELVTYGLKGIAAYADHAAILGHEDDEIYAFLFKALDLLTRDLTAEELLGLALEAGRVNIRTMELLHQANSGAYGQPVPTRVRITPVKGHAILVSGHDLKDLEELLKQTEGTGINVYTHGEMLPAHAYPGLKRYPHLVGNWGSAWQNQRDEFDRFPGAILMTTNCIQEPRESYKGRIFTSGLVQWPGVVHIANRDFTPVIEAALASPGFPEDEPEKTIMVGFGHHAVLGVADQVIDAVKRGAIRHFFLIGGCDGAKPGRNYYTELAKQVPSDCVILTLACGKYRFNTLQFGDIGGIPRLLDVGQCNDAYSAVQIALALAKAFGTDINGLPLSLILSWYEQKAVAILLSLLYLGVRNIRLGPSLPAFLTPAALQILQEQFNLMPITTPEEDLAAILG